MSPSRLLSIASAAALCLAGCDKLGSSSTSPKLNSRFVDSRGKSGSQSQSLGGLEGLYFGELEIVAYDYRPGESTQSHAGSSGFVGSDWSYWVALANGYDDARDNVLASSGQLDFTEFGDNAPPLDDAFVTGVGTFDIDFLEVYLYRTGIIQNGEYWGMNADLNGLDQHPLHKYPQWATIPDTFVQPNFPGFISEPGQDVNVFFARNDWFPAALTATMDYDTRTVASSSIPLTPDQKAKLESLIGQGTTRRFYQHIVVVPFASTITGPVSVDVSGGAQTSTTGNVFSADHLQITVNFDLSDILDPSTDLAAMPPVLTYKGDANNVPFGLSVAFATP